jgi:hypothetical protein
LALSEKWTPFVIGVLAIWALVVWKFSTNWTYDAALVAVGLVASALFVWWTKSSQSFAERNPALALM